ncbi:sugar ABC transporter ATP-binding protein [Bacteroidetes bacterium endosymbiont of Geopemphigus sp.]|uniref:sugar ABC transporter ATP-binding protein n=1 Tax=Bacteroidetes bacterium endosymbiont of Geopemphigus sp. TaxID=2047937 RepID=UPI000CD1BF81|nr:sugar ABC transporter ATP-binding protein [Bacteroidetes bacterium endosymbiont of Geopemphigus sp.]
MDKFKNYCVELLNISKSFGGTRALKKVTLKVKSEEIHALVGENGAGKSTLMKILSGAHQKDSGRILLHGREVSIKNPHQSKALGIGIIYQEFSLVPALSVAENIYLHDLGRESGYIQWRELRMKSKALIQKIGFDINPGEKIHRLSIAEQQIVEIAKALCQPLKVLILDEPSAVLGPKETEKLFQILRELKKEGLAIIYISHHLDEVLRLSDNITVLKDGLSSEALPSGKTNKDDIIQRMLGRSMKQMYPQRTPKIGREVLKVKELSSKNRVHKVSFSVKSGEIVGLSGLVGSGRTETLRAIFGADKKSSGHVFLQDKKISFSSLRKAVKSGLGLVPEDRKQQGVLLNLSIKNNISLTSLDELSHRSGFIKAAEEKENTKALIQKLSIKTKHENLKVEALSGGNQQKVALAKWLTPHVKVLLIDEPTRGVDIGAKTEIYQLLNEMAQTGVALLIVSSEIAELMEICDRILVMYEGKIQAAFEQKDFSEENLLRKAMGQ